MQWCSSIACPCLVTRVEKRIVLVCDRGRLCWLQPPSNSQKRSILRPCASLLVQVDGYAAALFDALDALLLGGGLLVRAVQSKSHSGKTLGLAEGAGLEGALLPADVPGDVEGVALSVAEAVDDGAADAAFFVDGLLQGLRLAPIPL